MDATPDREFDIVLLGATGFVGRLTAKHLARHAPSDVRIALAGRSGDRLTQVRASLDEAARDWPLVVVDITDTDAVRSLVERTRVVVSTVGPYLRHGLPLVEACAAAGTDYADLTGETLFVRRCIDAAHAKAPENGARIVPACGFDSIPSDLGVGLTAARARADGNGELADTVLHVRDLRGGVSGGSIDSMRQMALEVEDAPELRAMVSKPTCLVDGPDPTPTTVRPHRTGPKLPVGRHPVTGVWEAPFVMGGFNRQIVLRTDALTGAYGPAFRYREVIDAGSGPFGAVGAVGIAAGSTALMNGMGFKPTRWLLGKVLPDPGEGPTELARARGHFRLAVEATTTSGVRYLTRVSAEHDPGYDGTAVMLGESALSLALDDLPTAGGVLTPMSAMGETLAERLRQRGFTLYTEVVHA
jgi:short subunit dehydrogenase-like uncharacterized protein